MRAGGSFYKVMDEHSIIIAQDKPQNRRTYEDLVIQTFFLSNAEVKDMLTILRSLIDARKIATNEQLNAIILRDTADKVKVAERIIEANDKSKAEVVVDIELLQINTQRLRDLGVSLSNYSIGQQLDLRPDRHGGTTGTGGTGTGTTGTTTAATAAGVLLSDLQFINQANWLLTIPNFVYNFVKQNTDAQLLAKPQLRITEGEKANLVIGDRVPIPLTTFNTQNAGNSGGIVPITSFQYQDVGIKIELEPRVHHNQEVTLKLKIEVSNLNGNVAGSGGQSQPIIGTRTIDSVIRLKDGETNFLAGLIRTDESNTNTGLPGPVGDPDHRPPVLQQAHRGGAHRRHPDDDAAHHPQRPDHRRRTWRRSGWAPSRTSPSAAAARASSPRSRGRSTANEGTPEEIQDAIRRRLQRLPRGLRPGENGDDGGNGTAPGATPAQPRTRRAAAGRGEPGAGGAAVEHLPAAAAPPPRPRRPTSAGAAAGGRAAAVAGWSRGLRPRARRRSRCAPRAALGQRRR